MANAFRQTHLIPSGAQTGIPQVIAARGDRFAYASTLAIFIYNNDDQCLSKVRLESGSRTRERRSH